MPYIRIACCYGVGKATALKIRNAGHSLSRLGDQYLKITDIVEQATTFMAACYGQPQCSTMTEARQKQWAAKTGKRLTTAPKVFSLPLLKGHICWYSFGNVP